MSVNSDHQRDRKIRPPRAERRLAKKQNRIKHILLAQGIDLSELPTKILCVYNAGLDNGVTKERLLPLAQQHGCVIDIVMIPRRPYSFLVFSDMTEAEKCQAALKAVRISAEDSGGAVNAMLHPVFVNQAPGEDTQLQPLPPGLILTEDFVSEDYEATLLAAIDFDDVSPGAQKDLKHRKVKHYGYEFLYGVNNVDPSQPLSQGIPSECEGLISKATSARFINHWPDQLTVNQYSPGQGIPPHVDTPSAFEDGLMSISLGSQVVMEFQHPDGRHVSVLLPRRSLLVMTGESRYVWSHGITPRKSDIVTSPAGGLTLATRGTRTSLTFRKIIHKQNPPVEVNTSETGKLRNEKKGPVSEDEAAMLETTHVHKVYEEIASHFSDTRHTAWPRIAEFIKSLPAGSLLADIGCGNGKYLGLNKHIYEVCSDRSENLASICAGRGHQTFVGDVLSLPLRSGIFDVCICIAVIHHLSTQARRLNAVRELVRLLAPGGQLLVYVWAMEQERGKVKSKYLKGNPQQNLHPPVWVSKGKKDGEGRAGEESVPTSCQVVADESTLADSVGSGGGTVPVNDLPGAGPSVSETSSAQTSFTTASRASLKTETELENSTKTMKLIEDRGARSNHLSVHVNRTAFKEQDVLVPWQLKNKRGSVTKDLKEKSGGDSCRTFHRYYHVFRQGELEALCETLPNVLIKDSYYDQGNWCVLLEKLGD